MNNCKQTFASNNKMYTFLYSFYVWALRQVFTSFVKTLMYKLYFEYGDLPLILYTVVSGIEEIDNN